METNCIIPGDLFESILSRLPVRDLLRLRCVCKSWRALIDDSSFILTHHYVQYAIHKAHGDVPFFLWERLLSRVGFPIQCHLLSKHQGDDTVLNLTSDFERDINSFFPNDPNIRLDIFCRGSVNGIICLDILGIDLERLGRDISTCGLWNPASREFKIVAFPHTCA